MPRVLLSCQSHRENAELEYLQVGVYRSRNRVKSRNVRIGCEKYKSHTKGGRCFLLVAIFIVCESIGIQSNCNESGLCIIHRFERKTGLCGPDIDQTEPVLGTSEHFVQECAIPHDEFHLLLLDCGIRETFELATENETGSMRKDNSSQPQKRVGVRILIRMSTITKTKTIGDLFGQTRKKVEWKQGTPKKLFIDSLLIESATSTADEWLSNIRDEVKTLFWPRDTPELKFSYARGTTGSTAGTFGQVAMPRDQFLCGDRVMTDDGVELYPLYRYTDQTLAPSNWTPTLRKIRDWIHETTGQYCNHVVGNRYLNQNDYIGPHHDKSADMMPGTSIISLSLGAVRTLRVTMTMPENTSAPTDLLLRHGTLFRLGWKTNQQYDLSPYTSASMSCLIFGCALLWF